MGRGFTGASVLTRPWATTMLLRRGVGILAVALGLAGVSACVASAYAVWRVQARLQRANDLAFDAVDRGLTAVQERVPVVRERVRQSKVTTQDVTTLVRRWA